MALNEGPLTTAPNACSRVPLREGLVSVLALLRGGEGGLVAGGGLVQERLVPRATQLPS